MADLFHPFPFLANPFPFLAGLATACDGVLLGLALGVASASTWADYLYSSAALRRIKAAPFCRIADLRSLLESGDSDGKLVVVRGQVQVSPESGLTARKSRSGDLGVIVNSYTTQLLDVPYLLTFHHARMGRGSVLKVPFSLVESGQQPCCSHVHVSLDGLTQRLPLTTVYSCETPEPPSVESLLSVILGFSYPVAMVGKESILPIGKEITAVGICTNRDGALEITSCTELPYFLSEMTKVEIEADLANTNKILFWSGLVLGTFSVSILTYTIIRNWQTLKGFWTRIHPEELADLDEEQHESEDLEDLPEAELCVICLARPRLHAFLPCGHRLCCQTCAVYVKRQSSVPRCPFCRQLIHSSIRIYNS